MTLKDAIVKQPYAAALLASAMIVGTTEVTLNQPFGIGLRDAVFGKPDPEPRLLPDAARLSETLDYDLKYGRGDKSAKRYRPALDALLSIVPDDMGRPESLNLVLLERCNQVSIRIEGSDELEGYSAEIKPEGPLVAGKEFSWSLADVLGVELSAPIDVRVPFALSVTYENSAGKTDTQVISAEKDTRDWRSVVRYDVSKKQMGETTELSPSGVLLNVSFGSYAKSLEEISLKITNPDILSGSLNLFLRARKGVSPSAASLYFDKSELDALGEDQTFRVFLPRTARPIYDYLEPVISLSLVEQREAGELVRSDYNFFPYGLPNPRFSK